MKTFDYKQNIGKMEATVVVDICVDLNFWNSMLDKMDNMVGPRVYKQTLGYMNIMLISFTRKTSLVNPRYDSPNL
jgi:hypothetical protein